MRLPKKNTLLIGVALVVIVVLCVIFAGQCRSMDQKNDNNRPLREILNEVNFQGSAEEWVNSLTDEQRATIERAYESNSSSGYQGTKQSWISEKLFAHYNSNNGIVVVLPDGNELTVSEDEINERNLANIDDLYSIASNHNDHANSSVNSEQPANGGQAASLPSDSGKTQGARLVIDNVQSHPGDTDVVVPVRIEGNPGILGTTLSVSYDESVLTLKSAANGDAFKGVLSLTQSASLGSGCLFTWDGIELRPEDIKDGIILSLSFEISRDAAPGVYTVAVRNNNSTFDTNLNEVSLFAQDGNVIVG